MVVKEESIVKMTLEKLKKKNPKDPSQPNENKNISENYMLIVYSIV